MNRTSVQERMVIYELSQAGYTDQQIAAQLKWKPATVRKWRRKAQRQGAANLTSALGRPRQGCLSTYSQAVVDQLRTWRTAHPGWGAKTLKAELQRSAAFAGQPRPDRSSIARWLKAEAQTRRYQRHTALPSVACLTSRAPHEEWEMDARGHQRVADVGVVSLIAVNDVFSKTKLLSYPCVLGSQRASRHATTEDYQLVLRLAFTRWGLPDRLAVDHDAVFYDNTCKSPYPSRLQLWLLALGVQLTFGRFHCPTDQATTERSHQTWYHQVLEGQVFPTWQTLFDALEHRQTFLNEHLPCSTLDEQPPLVAYPQARLPRREYRPEWEADLLDVTRIYPYLAQGRWFRTLSNVGAFCLGNYRYGVGTRWAKHEVVITFDPTDQHLVVGIQTDQPLKRLPIKGLSSADLMAELHPFTLFNRLQLALPFSPHDWRAVRLSETLGG